MLANSLVGNTANDLALLYVKDPALKIFGFDRPDCQGIAMPVNVTDYTSQFLLKNEKGFTISSFNISRSLRSEEHLNLSPQCRNENGILFGAGTPEGCHNVDAQSKLNCIYLSSAE